MNSTYKTFHDILYGLSPISGNDDSLPSKEKLNNILKDLGSQWAEAVSPTDESLLIDRFQIDNLNSVHIEKLIKQLEENESIDQISSSKILRQVLQTLESSDDMQNSTYFKKSLGIPFEHLWWPVVDVEIDRLYHEAMDHLQIDSYWVEGMLESLGHHLLDSLSSLSLKIIYPLYNSKITLRDLLIKHVQKKSKNKEISSTYYNEFVCSMRKEGVRRIICKHPPFGRILQITIDNWRKNSLNIVSRTFRDRYLIAKEFTIDKNFTITQVEHKLETCTTKVNLFASYSLKKGILKVGSSKRFNH